MTVKTLVTKDGRAGEGALWSRCCGHWYIEIQILRSYVDVSGPAMQML
jgi:hypothetical protein